MIILIKTLQVILALSILILIHEFGHFIFAKMFGIRVDKFFLFSMQADRRSSAPKADGSPKYVRKLQIGRQNTE